MEPGGPGRPGRPSEGPGRALKRCFIGWPGFGCNRYLGKAERMPRKWPEALFYWMAGFWMQQVRFSRLDAAFRALAGHWRPLAGLWQASSGLWRASRGIWRDSDSLF